MKSMTKVVMAFAVMVGLTATAIAGNGEGFRKACGADKQKFCADVKQGGGRIITCLEANLASLAPECAVVVKAKEMKVCHEDVQKLCDGVKPGEGRIIACLETNRASLSAACATQLTKTASQKK